MRGLRTLLSMFVLTVLVLPYSGCGKKDQGVESQVKSNQASTADGVARETGDNVSQGGKEGTSLADVLAIWDRGDKDAAAKGFLSIRWNDPVTLANVPSMNLSEKQFQSLSQVERDRIMKSYAEVRTKLLIGIARHARSVGDNALAAGDKQTAKAYYEGILRCGQAFSSPDRLSLMKLDGDATQKMAQERLAKCN